MLLSNPTNNDVRPRGITDARFSGVASVLNTGIVNLDLKDSKMEFDRTIKMPKPNTEGKYVPANGTHWVAEELYDWFWENPVYVEMGMLGEFPIGPGQSLKLSEMWKKTAEQNFRMK